MMNIRVVMTVMMIEALIRDREAVAGNKRVN